MSDTDLHLKHTCLERLREHSDFNSKYFAVYHLQTIAKSNPLVLDHTTIKVLASLFKDDVFSKQRQSLFLFRMAAETLTAIVQHVKGHPLKRLAFSALKDILGTTSGHPHRAAAEALGCLPFVMNRPELRPILHTSPPLLSWKRLLVQLEIEISKAPAFFGRSLVAPLNGRQRLLVIKFARKCDNCERLRGESLWLYRLKSEIDTFPVRFRIPEPIRVDDSFLFRLRKIPNTSSRPEDLDPEGHAIAFLADHRYFVYPNQNSSTDHLSNDAFKEVMGRNAWLLGRMSGLGIIHSAPIPLFHNRVQAHRRRDFGAYEWFRAGRLDRWLESCAYPNLGVTGLRDFEHLEAFKGSHMQLYRAVGNHLLSLFLVTGSFFRNKESDRVGQDGNGKPVDARDLFDESALKEILEDIFQNYYKGFVDARYEGDIPVDFDHIVCRMIDEMGVDRYMEEIFRIADQDAMNEETFRCFLKERGMREEDIAMLTKGERDIVLFTGPHLGGFNRPISLPEMIDCISTMSALCMAGKFWKESNAVTQSA